MSVIEFRTVWLWEQMRAGRFFFVCLFPKNILAMWKLYAHVMIGVVWDSQVLPFLTFVCRGGGGYLWDQPFLCLTCFHGLTAGVSSDTVYSKTHNFSLAKQASQLWAVHAPKLNPSLVWFICPVRSVPWTLGRSKHGFLPSHAWAAKLLGNDHLVTAVPRMLGRRYFEYQLNHLTETADAQRETNNADAPDACFNYL